MEANTAGVVLILETDEYEDCREVEVERVLYSVTRVIMLMG